MEPVPANMGMISPDVEFLKAMREIYFNRNYSYF